MTKSDSRCFSLIFVQIILLVFSIAVSAKPQNISSACSVKFNDKCSCGVIEYNYRSQYVVNCTNAGFTNTSVLEYMPSDVEVLIFTGNFLTTLTLNIFGTINDYPKLHVIDMSNNHIRIIHGKTYHHVRSVERLILNHNNISISPTDDEQNSLHPRIFSNFINLKELHLTNAFADYTSPALSKDLHSIFMKSNLTKLIKLHLEQNEITKFNDGNVFCDLPELEDLHLADNNLNEINFNLLCLKRLRFLDLERNQFEIVREKDLNLLNLVASKVHDFTVDFSLNPFSCDCVIYPFVNWIHSTNVTIRQKDNLKCHRSSGYQPLLQLTFPKCKVQSLAHHSGPGHTAALVFFCVAFSIAIIAIFGAIIYLSKERIKHFVSPVISSRKVYYTTIKDDEIHEVIV